MEKMACSCDLGNLPSKDLFEIRTDEKLGRYVTASVALKAGDVIFHEKPFAFGPKSNTPLVCLGCNRRTDGATLCPECGWPVCAGGQCAKWPVHRDNECSIFATRNIRFFQWSDSKASCPQLECITPLRVLLEKIRNPTRWTNQIEPMESHDSDRSACNPDLWRFYQINIVEYLRGRCGLGDVCSAELLHKICGILEVNAFEGAILDPSVEPLRFLYPKLALLSHNCISNIRHSIHYDLEGATSSNYAVVVRASINIARAGPLYSSYTYPLWPTVVRRAVLKQTKYFDCDCARCRDPTELGTEFSTLKCQQCGRGQIRPIEPLRAHTLWQCDFCPANLKSSQVLDIFHNAQKQIDRLMDPNNFQELYVEFKRIFHPNNAYLLALKIDISKYMEQETEKVQFYKDTLDVLNIIEPGHTRLRGLILFQLYSALEQWNRPMNPKNEVKWLNIWEEREEFLRESVRILQDECGATHEGKILQQIQNPSKFLKQIES